PRGRVDRDLALLIQDARAKSDRRYMSFACRPQAQNETQRTGRQVRLVRMRDDRWIEQSRRFQRILMGVVGAKQQFPFFGKLLVDHESWPNLLKSSSQEATDLYVTAAKVVFHLLQQVPNFSFRKSHDVRANSGHSLLSGHIERAHQHSGAI